MFQNVKPNDTKRKVILEKFIIPKWFKHCFSRNFDMMNEYESEENQYEYEFEMRYKTSFLNAYKIFLRILNGSEVIVTHKTNYNIIEIDKWSKNSEILYPSLWIFFLDNNLLAKNGGNFHLGESYYDIYSRN